MAQIQCLVTFKHMKKLVSGSSGEEIVANVGELFNLSTQQFNVQRFDEDWDDWIDVDPCDIVNRQKLRILLAEPVEIPIVVESNDVWSTIQSMSESSGASSAGDTDLPSTSENSDDGLSATATTEEVTPEVATVPRPLQTDSASASNSDSARDITSTETVRLATWPNPFRLPTFRPSLKKALSEKRVLKSSEKASLMTHLYEEMTKYTFRPTPANYCDVATTLILEYPHLKNGLIGQHAVDYWKSPLSNRFRNERKRHERDNPLAQPPKKRQPTTETTPDSRPAFGAINYLPPRPPGESESTIKQHILILRNESTKTRQDVQKIQHLMDITLSDRRDGIVNRQWSVKKVKDVYPCLFNEEEILKEFQRITSLQLLERVTAGLSKYGSALLSLRPAKHLDIWEELKSAISSAATDEDKKYITSCAALIMIPVVLNEKICGLLRPEGEGSADAHIEHPVGDGLSISTLLDPATVFHIIAEKEVVCSTTNLVIAFGALLAVHYAFDLSYPKANNNTLTFLQKVLINMDDETTTPVKVVKLLFSLNSILETGESCK